MFDTKQMSRSVELPMQQILQMLHACCIVAHLCWLLSNLTLTRMDTYDVAKICLIKFNNNFRTKTIFNMALY